MTGDELCRCGHAWRDHFQTRLDMIECWLCTCEEFVDA